MHERVEWPLGRPIPYSIPAVGFESADDFPKQNATHKGRVDMAARLIAEFGKTDAQSLEDLLLIMASNVEKSMMQAGANAGKDYNYKDLFMIAAPLAAVVYSRSDKVTYSAEW
jgi:hypothetical protein